MILPPAWRCESYRQITLVDGVVPRSARRGFGEPHSSVKILTAASAAARISSTKRWFLISSFYGQMCLSDSRSSSIPYLGPNLPLDLGRSVEHWRRLALLRSGEVEPYTCPPRAQCWGRKKELLGADITAGTVTNYRCAFVDFNFFPENQDTFW